MKLFLTFLIVCLAGWSFSTHHVTAQDEARAAWQVTNFDVAVNNLGAERALNARTIVTVRNVGHGPGATLSLRLNAKAEIKSASVGSANASFKAAAEVRGGVQRVTINLPGSVQPNESISATLDYRLPVEENTGLASISPLGSQFLPSSLWVPAPSTPTSVRGADYAPFRLTVNGASIISSGQDKTAGGDGLFVQTLNAEPFLVSGNWDRIDGSGNGKGISAYLTKGASAGERKQAEALVALTADARAFCAEVFGPAPDVPVRLVEVSRGSGFDDAGVLLLGFSAFQRRKIDAVTAQSIGEAVARIWIGADTPARGEGHGVLREGLARFVATLFLEKEFGADAAAGERARQRLAYSAIAKRDLPLTRTTPLDGTYINSISNKGAMVWRLIDHFVGRSNFAATMRALLSEGKTNADGLTVARARALFSERGGTPLKTLLDKELDEPTDMDLMAGLPHMDNGKWVAALRNIGSTEAAVSVTGTTDTGQRLTVQGTIAAHDFGQVVFNTATKVVRVEVDPEKFYPQLDYSNDIAPHSVDQVSALAEATRLFGAQESSKAESLASDLLAANPDMQEARIVYARALLAENKTAEAEREFRRLADERLPTPAALAWSSIGLGEIALRRGQAAEAVKFFEEAVRADGDYASAVAARAARIRAEGGSSPIDPSAKAFIAQLDAVILSGRQAELTPMLVPGELTVFVRGVMYTTQEAWQTRVLRTEQLDANRVAVDVSLNTKQSGIEHSGTAVYILTRVGGSWKLNAIEFFEVK